MKKLAWLLVIFPVVLMMVVWQKRVWDGKTRFTVIDLGDPVQVKSFEPATGLGIILTIPGNLEIDAVGGRGEWRVAVLSKAGREWGQKWEADSLGDYLGITYTGIAGRLPVWDKLVWWWWEKRGQWQRVGLGDTSWVTEVTDPDGVVFLRLTEQWPEKASEWFSAANLAREPLNVTIVNSTAVGGLGAHVARIIENGGLRVVAVENTPSEIDKCILSGDKTAKESLAGKWLSAQFGCVWEMKDGAGEINLVVGSEYRKWWRGS